MIKTRVSVASADGDSHVDDAIALWDTGSELCGISKSLAERLGLKPVGKKPISYGDGEMVEENVYVVTLTFPPSGIRAMPYAVEFGSNDEDFIIGMNLLVNGTMLIEPAEDGCVRFSFTL